MYGNQRINLYVFACGHNDKKELLLLLLLVATKSGCDPLTLNLLTIF